MINSILRTTSQYNVHLATRNDFVFLSQPLEWTHERQRRQRPDFNMHKPSSLGEAAPNYSVLLPPYQSRSGDTIRQSATAL